MKKGLVVILFLTLPLLSLAQQEVANTITTDPVKELIEGAKVEQPAVKKSSSSKMKAKIINLKHKKSNDIISIKAYRKSLQIKVKTKRLC